MSSTSRTSRNAVGENARVPETASTQLSPKTAHTSRFAASSGDASPHRELQAARELLDHGGLGQAEERLRRLTNRRSGDANFLAEARRLLAVSLEAQSRHDEALEAIVMYEPPAAREKLDFDTAMRLRTQIAVAYKRVGDYPKAITLLQTALRDAGERLGMDSHLGAINARLADVYRSLNEYRIARDYSHKAIEQLRRTGDWRELADAYRGIGLTDLYEGRYEDTYRHFKQVIQIIGDENAPHLLASTYSTLGGTCWWLRRLSEGITYLEKALSYYENAEHKLNAISCYNNLGLILVSVGDWLRAEQMIERGIALARDMEGVKLPSLLATQIDSLGELFRLRGDVAKSRRCLDEAKALVAESGDGWYVGQILCTSSRCYLAMHDSERGLAEAKRALDVGIKIGDRQAICAARLLIAAAHLHLGAVAACRRELHEVEMALANTVADLPLIGEVQRLHGQLVLLERNEVLAAHHFHRYLSICEVGGDSYHTAQAHADLGLAYAQGKCPHRAAHHLALAAHTFRALGAKAGISQVEGQLKQLDLTQADEMPDPTTVAHLLTLRLSEASVSRDLLLRELAAICYAETRADALMIVEAGEGDEPRLVVAHGSTNADSKRLARELWAARTSGKATVIAEEQGASLIWLGKGGVPPALLLVAPVTVTLGEHKNLFDALLRVTELGLEAYALRHNMRVEPDAEEPTTSVATSVMPGFIHTSPAMAHVVEETQKIHSSNVTVLVTGESGTGKELVARLVHTLSDRRESSFIPFNCTAVPKELSEAYLFGYRRGAFTGATADSPGVIRTAEGGTLFLDEVGDLPLDVQPKLLRFLQEGEIQPLGEQRPIKTDVRIVAATNSDLERAVTEGRFREDLYYRLNVIRLLVPPLRERRSEIPALVNHYIEHYGAKFGRRGLRISEQALELLTIAEWAGNIRQLCNEVQRFVARVEDDTVIVPEHLSPEVRRALPTTISDIHTPRAASSIGGAVIPLNIGAAMLHHTTLASAVGDLEQRMIADSMQRHAGNISRVARELGLTRRGLYLKLDRYGFETAG